MNGLYEISIKIDFDKFSNQNEEQFIRELQDKLKFGLEQVMNQMRIGNGLISEIHIRKKEQ